MWAPEPVLVEQVWLYGGVQGACDTSGTNRCGIDEMCALLSPLPSSLGRPLTGQASTQPLLFHLLITSPPPSPPPTQSSVLVPMVSSDPNSPSVVLITFSPGTTCLPRSVVAALSVTYTTSTGEVRT